MVNLETNWKRSLLDVFKMDERDLIVEFSAIRPLPKAIFWLKSGIRNKGMIYFFCCCWKFTVIQIKKNILRLYWEGIVWWLFSTFSIIKNPSPWMTSEGFPVWKQSTDAHMCTQLASAHRRGFSWYCCGRCAAETYTVINAAFACESSRSLCGFVSNSKPSALLKSFDLTRRYTCITVWHRGTETSLGVRVHTLIQRH